MSARQEKIWKVVVFLRNAYVVGAVCFYVSVLVWPKREEPLPWTLDGLYEVFLDGIAEALEQYRIDEGRYPATVSPSFVELDRYVPLPGPPPKEFQKNVSLISYSLSEGLEGYIDPRKPIGAPIEESPDIVLSATEFQITVCPEIPESSLEICYRISSDDLWLWVWKSWGGRTWEKAGYCSLRYFVLKRAGEVPKERILEYFNWTKEKEKAEED